MKVVPALTRGLAIMSTIVLIAAFCAVSGAAYFALRPHYPVAALVIDSQTPMRAPLSGQDVCAVHMCVEFPNGGSRCFGREFAEGVTLQPPGGEALPWDMRFGSSGLNILSEEGANHTAEPDEFPVPTTDERVRARCAAQACTWVERVVRCGSEHELGFRLSTDTVTVESPNGGHGAAMGHMFLFVLSLVLVFVGAVLSWASRRIKPEED